MHSTSLLSAHALAWNHIHPGCYDVTTGIGIRTRYRYRWRSKVSVSVVSVNSGIGLSLIFIILMSSLWGINIAPFSLLQYLCKIVPYSDNFGIQMHTRISHHLPVWYSLWNWKTEDQLISLFSRVQFIFYASQCIYIQHVQCDNNGVLWRPFWPDNPALCGSRPLVTPY